MLITGQPISLEELRGEDLHVARQHHQVDIAAQQVKLASFGLGADLLVRPGYG